MNIQVEFGWKSVFHYGEEVCGDRVEAKRGGGRFIGVLADGMGSGVKANILSTMGSTILSTMLLSGQSVEESVDTVIRTLPVCSERGMNYCTFSVVTIDGNGEANLVEFDNPQAWILRNNQLVLPEKMFHPVEDKAIWESNVQLIDGDVIVVASDGVVNAGAENHFSFGWTWHNVADWLCKEARKYSSAPRLANALVTAIDDIYKGRPTDDVTAMVLRIPPEQTVNLLYGPPEDRADDENLVRTFMAADGLKIVCGGTTSNLVSRVLDSPIETLPETAAEGVPPISFLAEIDLVTEGVLTLTRAGEIMEQYFHDSYGFSDFDLLDAQNGAAMLAKQLLEACSTLHVYIGKARNAGYEGKKQLPLNLDVKMQAIDKICKLLEDHGRAVDKRYF